MLWNKAFQCNIPHIDAQHKALFEHIEQLGNMHGDISRIPKTIEFLELYTAEHFNDEESLHAQTRYPRALEHQRAHRTFINQIKKLRADYESSGHNLATLMDMNRALVKWLTEHILQMDRQFVEFFRPLPEEVKGAVTFPYRPWIPDAAQGKGQATGMGTKVVGGTTRMIGGSWTDSMLCGIPAIDDQHKELFRQIDILRNRGNKDRVPAVLRFLTDYVVKHFNDEEGLHLRSRYPAATGHRKLHTDFVDTFLELKKKYDNSGGDFAIVMELNKVIYDWLKAHVLKVDKEFAKYYHELQENAQQENS
jgi:hemerythrin